MVRSSSSSSSEDNCKSDDNDSVEDNCREERVADLEALVGQLNISGGGEDCEFIERGPTRVKQSHANPPYTLPTDLTTDGIIQVREIPFLHL